MKWEALLAMLGLFLLGLWLVVGPGEHLGLPPAREGAELHEVRIGDQRGALELQRAVPATNQNQPLTPDPLTNPEPRPASPTFRLLWRDGGASPIMSERQARDALGDAPIDAALAAPPSTLFRILNITSWASLLWVGIGLAGQAAFFARMAIQWLVSEREKRSLVPPMFWYLSLVGGIALFAYFVWRQDIVGVLGQTTGVVIYARNVRLLSKHDRRERRRAERAANATNPSELAPPPDASIAQTRNE